MNNRSIRRVVALALVSLMAFGSFLLTGCGRSYEYIFGDVEWLSTCSETSADAEKMIKDTYYYSDDWF